MIGVLVATHGLLAKELLNSAGMLVGSGEQMSYCCVLPGQPPEEFRHQVEQEVVALDQGEGVVALVDIAGGTPNNTLFMLSKSHRIRIVVGVNLPMVMCATVERWDGMSMDELVQMLIQTGKNEVAEFGQG